ncbi:MAG: Maf family protein [Desulfobacterales bacterium]
METNHQKRKIILASESPRRKRLLQQAGIEFRVVPSGFDEASVNAQPPVKHARSLAEAKSAAVSQNMPDAWVIGADSIVTIDDAILNKPESQNDAYKMLSRLSGRTHRVVTGYSIVCRALTHIHSDACITQVTFKSLSDAEIRWYLQTPEPWDKAGAYAIQGTAAFMVRQIQGSYTNVVGLPVCEVVDHLLQAGAIDMTPGTNETNLRQQAAVSK